MNIVETEGQARPTAEPEDTIQPLLRVTGLQVAYGSGQRRTLALKGVSFDVHRGETVAVVGESGSGKSTTAHAVMRLLPTGGAIVGGSITLEGEELTRLREAQMRRLRGARIGLIPQDPMSSLNPLNRIGKQLKETLAIHGRLKGNGDDQVAELLEHTGLPVRARKQYPYQLSGGMRQRVLIASALACTPSLVIADEPTSALDVTVQRQILDHIGEVSAATGASVLLITHDLAVAADRADRIVVMKDGRVVETGTAEHVLGNPSDEYTQQLLASAPSLSSALLFGPVPAAASHEQPVVAATGLRKVFSTHGEEHVAVEDASFEVHRGETLAIVGESGSGKSTTARLLLRLERADAGTITLHDSDITRLWGDQMRPHRRKMQMVYQNPYGSLSPQLKVGDIITEPLKIHGQASTAKRRALAGELLEQVSLDPAFAERRAAQLSGGQRQRVAIARALALEPSLIVCDEPVSALDVTVQAQILNLLARIQQERQVAYLFISHDLAVVRQIAHRVLVVQEGRIVEEGVTSDVFASPSADYTRTLLSAIPGPEVAGRPHGHRMTFALSDTTPHPASPLERTRP